MMLALQVMVNRDGVLTIKGERKFEVRPAPHLLAESLHLWRKC